MMGVDSRGDYAIASSQFDFVDDETMVRTERDVDPNTSHTTTALEEAEYTLVRS